MDLVKLGLKNFIGNWALEREILDGAEGRGGQLVGEAVFRPLEGEDSALIYEEKGRLLLDGVAPLMAERRYIWRPGKGNVIKVLFEDGRRFHEINLDQTMPFDTHFCPPDVYDLTYDFRAWPKWQASVRVEGPRKTYRLHSRYQFLGPLDSAR